MGGSSKYLEIIVSRRAHLYMFIEDGRKVVQTEDGDVVFADVFQHFFEFRRTRHDVVGNVLCSNGYNGIEHAIDIVFVFGTGDDHFSGFEEQDDGG